MFAERFSVESHPVSVRSVYAACLRDLCAARSARFVTTVDTREGAEGYVTTMTPMEQSFGLLL